MANASIQLHGETFPSKEALKRFVKKFLGENLGKTLYPHQEQFKFLLDLFKRHPEGPSRLPKPIASIMIGRDFSNRGYEVIYRTVEGQRDKISWVQCCMARGPTERLKYTAKKREEIWDQRLRFRMKADREDYCENCAEFTRYLEVDHWIPFVKLLADWESDNQELTWPDYHAKFAQLQLLCVPCHKEKSIT